MSVEPVMSEKTTVTIFRWSTGVRSPIGVPQNWQNRARSAFSPPQFPQTTMRGV